MAADCRIPNKDEEEEGMLPFSDCQNLKAAYLINRSCYNKRTKHNFKGSHINAFKAVGLVLSLLLVLLDQHPVCSLLVNCDSVKSCICGKEDDGGWRIECPNDNSRFEYPIELKVKRLDSDNYKEASLTVQCNDANIRDPWSYIKGMDLSSSQLYSKIVRLEIYLCPPVDDGWSKLLKTVNLTGTDIQRFSFIRDAAKPVDIPSNFFENMPNIAYLNLRNNDLTKIPDLSSLKNLTSLNLRQNKLEMIPAGTFTHNTQLTSIALTLNKISAIAPKTFPVSVEHLELNSNDISYLNASTFSNLVNLKRLYLNSNKLDSIDSDTFDGMPSLEELLLYNSKMVQFPNFFNLPKLANLSISSAINSRSIPAPGGGEDITTTLSPEYLPENTLVLKNLPSLQNVNLRLNHFTTLPVMENLPKLFQVDLARNDIVEIESGAFDLPTLKILNLSRNRLRKLGAMRAISLTELNLSDNQLTELRNDTFAFMNSLTKLSLARNQIETVTHKTFEPLTDLRELDLSFNKVTFSSSPSPNANGMLPEHDEYNFFGDSGNQSPLRFLFKLTKLNLTHNNIERLGFSDWTQVFTQITVIDLSYNKIKHVTANDLNFLSYNLTLNLEYNKISTVDLRMSFLLEPNAHDEKKINILLSGNPLECDCLAYFLKTWNLESYEMKIRDLNCSSPAELKGRRLTDVPNDKLFCAMGNETGCPMPCSCKERSVDKTVLVDCSGRKLTLEDIPKLNTFKGKYAKWMIELDLSNNQIVNFNNTAYIKEFLNKTSKINLSGNNLTDLQFFESIDQNTTFAISNNKFACTNCAGFQIPWRAYPTRISDLANVTCLIEQNEGFFDSAIGHPSYDLVYVQEESKKFENYCANTSSRLAVVVILPLVIAVILLSCLCIGLFVSIRYGWAIKAYLYSKGWCWCLFWERDLDADEDGEGNEKLYDAFISYSHKDEEWVLDELVKKLEDEEGFKLCLHFRDWIAGEWIPSQIINSVQRSRRTIVILSSNFVESVWSRLEFKAAHAQALKDRSNRVILILLGEDLKECDVQDDDLKMYMKMNTFMKWNDPLFWHRLKYAMPHRKTCSNSTEEELKHNAINKMQQRDRAIKLDKLRAKLEQNV